MAQHQDLVFELEFPLGPTAVAFRWAKAQAEAAHHLQLLPARQPVAQLLQEHVSCKHLFGCRLELDQRRGGHEAVQLEKLGPLRWIGELQAHLKTKVFLLEKRNEAPDISAGPVPGSSHQEQLQVSPLR